VADALSSAKNSRTVCIFLTLQYFSVSNIIIKLAHRIFYSFVKPGQDSLLLTDIAKYFPTPEAAENAFALFDKDENGDATLDEVELVCIHRLFETFQFKIIIKF